MRALVFVCATLVASRSFGTDADWQVHGQGPQPAGANEPRDRVHALRAGGLGFEVGVDSWPRLFQRPVPYYGADYYSWVREHLPHGDFGTVALDGAPSGKMSLDAADWCHIEARFRSEDPDGALRAWISRVSPAVVFETRARAVTFFRDARSASPAYLAERADGVIHIVPVDRAAELPLAELQRSWLLVWFGKKSRFNACDYPWPTDFRSWVAGPHFVADCPMLLVFENSPVELAPTEKGLRARFNEPAGHFALLPLYGQLHPHMADTEQWAHGLPEKVAQTCDWWALHLAEVPMSAREEYARDPSGDQVRLTERFSFLRLRPGGERFAPLPPMMALARTYGLPISASAKVQRTSVLTAYGPYEGIEGTNTCSVAIEGLGKYALSHAQIGQERREPAELAQRLATEIRKVLEAGHLAPWYIAMTDFGAGYEYYWRMQGRLAWSNPGETLYVLAQALPVLPDALANSVRDYMRRERRAFPPEEVAHTPVASGARRELYTLPPGLLPEQQKRVLQNNFYIVNHLLPPENLYYLATYYDALHEKPGAAEWNEARAILQPYLKEQDWAGLGWFKRWQPDSFEMAGTGGAPDANHFFAAAVGAIRLARMVGDKEAETLGWGLLARAAMLRFGMAKYAHYLLDNRLYVLPEQPDWMIRFSRGSWTGRLYTYNWTSAEDDVRTIGRMDQFGVQFDDGLNWYFGTGLTKLRGLVPEEALFFKDYLRPEIAAFAQRVEENSSDWYLAMAKTFLGAEFYYQQPQESYSLFLAQAWVLGRPPAWLQSRLDVPWMQRGDLYYIHKLAETIKAWRRINPSE